MTFKTFKTCILDEWPLKPLKSHLGPLLTCFFDVVTCIFLIFIFSVLRVMFFEVVIADHQSRVLTRPFQHIGPTHHKSHPTHWQASWYTAKTLWEILYSIQRISDCLLKQNAIPVCTGNHLLLAMIPRSPAGSPERQLGCQAQLGRQGRFCSAHFSSQARAF